MKFSKTFKPLFFFSIFANVLMLVAPLHMLQVYDRVLTSGSTETLVYITMIGVGCLVLYGVTETIRSVLAQRISAKYAVTVANPLFEGLSSGKVPMEKSNQIMREFNTVKSFIASRSLVGLFDLPFSPLFLVLLFVLHFQLGLITTIGAGILVAIAWLNKTTTEKAQTDASSANAEALGFAGAIVQRSEDIRAMGILPSLIGRWGRIMGKSLNAQDDASGRAAYYFGISKAARQILQISIMAWGAWLVLQGSMSGGMIIAASMISQRALQPIEQVIGGWEQISRSKSAYLEIEALLEQASTEETKVEQPAPRGDLSVQGFAYNVENDGQQLTLIKDVDFSAEPGELIAIVGPSGAGKSTLARAIAGAAEKTSSQILLDGCAQKNWQPEQWGKYVGYVGQDVNFFPGTIAENIARMDENPSEKRLVDAARLSGAHELINSFPNGYMTQLGAGKYRLSGGQKQRIAMARALYTGPRLLVLDEPNAHLDQEGDAILSRALMQIKENGVTVLVVTQRPQILRLAEKILTIKDGKQVDFRENQTKKPIPTTQTSASQKTKQAISQSKTSKEIARPQVA